MKGGGHRHFGGRLRDRRRGPYRHGVAPAQAGPKEPIVPVICPGCATRYALPSHLLGASGARIRCPACGLTFVLGPNGELTAVLGRADSPEPAGAPAAPAAHAAHGIALGVLRALDDPPGSLALAEAEGRLFSGYGPALLGAFEALARESATDESAAAFRDALFDVAGLDLSVAASELEDASRPDWHTHG